MTSKLAKKGIFGKLRYMFRMRKLIILLGEMPLPPTGSPIEDWFDGKVKRKAFIHYLIYKTDFRRDFRDTFERWSLKWSPGWLPTFCEPGGNARARKRRLDIIDILDKCLERDYISGFPYIDLDAGVRTQSIIAKHTGRDFVRWLRFTETCLREYGTLVSVILGGGIAFIFLSLTGLWNALIEALSKLTI